MSRNAISIALSLALLTGIVVGQLTAVGSPGTVPGPEQSARRLELVRGFYEGMNAYLATGDDRFLRLLTSDFREIASGAGEPGTIETLIDRLDAMRSNSLVPRFTVHEMTDLGSVVQTRVSTTAPASLDRAGFAIVIPLPEVRIEFLQVHRYAISARWSDDAFLPRVDALGEAAFDGEASRPWRIEINHVSLQPGAQLPLESDVGTWMIVEQGTISISAEAGIERVATGEARAFPFAGHRKMMNYETSIASFWYASVHRTSAADPYRLIPHRSDHPGATIEVLTDTLVGAPGSADVRLRGSLALATLSPGTQFDALDTVIEQHVAVIRGGVDAVIHDGQLMYFDGSSVATSVRREVAMTAGSAVATVQGGSATFRVGEDEFATVLLFTISA